jgi:hypothetical protein
MESPTTEPATLAGANHAGTALGLANSFVFVAFFLVLIAIPGAFRLLVVDVWLVAAFLRTDRLADLSSARTWPQKRLTSDRQEDRQGKHDPPC